MSKKNSKNITSFNSSKYKYQQQQDSTSFVSLMLCSGGMFLRNKFIIWAAIFFMISTLCRRKFSGSLLQYLVNAFMIIFALVSTYMLHPYMEQQAVMQQQQEMAQQAQQQMMDQEIITGN